MPLTMRTIVTLTIPTLAALFGIFWFRRKKKPPSIEGAKPPKEESVTAEDKESMNRELICNSSPQVYVTQPSQPTPQEESFDVTEALDKAVAESVTEVSETQGESDSEEESVESVVTAIEASNANTAPVNESDVGIIEDAATSSGSELNTPSPCDAVDKQIVSNDATVETKSSPVETEHIEKIEVESHRSVLLLKESCPSNSVGKDDNEEPKESNSLTNGVNGEVASADENDVEKSQESHLSNGKLENEITARSDPSEDEKSLSWSETIEMSENNNVDKIEVSLDPYKTNASPQVTDCNNDKKSNATAKSPVSASKSQGNVSITASSKYQSSKQSKSASSKSPKANESKKSARSQQSSKGKVESRGKDHQSGFQKSKQLETAKISAKEESEESTESVKMNGEDTDWGSQAEALPNGSSDSHSEVRIW